MRALSIGQDFGVYTTSVTLLERVRAVTDQAAWDRFVSLYSPVLARWAIRCGCEENEAADLVQDVLILLMKELPQFQYDPNQGSFRSWLKTVVIRKTRERYRKNQAEANRLHKVDAREHLDDEQLAAVWEREYQTYVIQRAIELMKAEFEETTWRACWEHLVSGRSAVEVGAELGLSEGAVYVAKSRVLKRVRQELAGLLD